MSLDTIFSPDEQYSTILVTEVTVELEDSSSKWIQSISVQIDGVDVNGQIKTKGSAETTHQLTVEFWSPRNVETSVDLIARLRYRNVVKENWRSVPFKISAQDLRVILCFGKVNGEWQKTYDEERVTVTIGITSQTSPVKERSLSNASVPSVMETLSDHGIDPLIPTTDHILLDCPRFRILVMGNTGVGKSQLINKTFGVTEAIVAHNERGHANINDEILSKHNSHFVLHDSMGFESGDDANVKVVQDFIEKRSNMALRDQLHAIWLCINIPLAGGRLLESGIERFLAWAMTGGLGKVPVIVVFTKYDLLVDEVEISCSIPEGLSGDAIVKFIEQKAQSKLQVMCVKPFEKFTKHQIPHIAVSAEKDEYAALLLNLIQLTYSHVRRVSEDAAVVSAMAQCISPTVNIKASIHVGRRKYWKRLMSSVNFPGKTLQQCLDVIHTDIVAVWKFDDPDGHLSSPLFRALIMTIVTEGGKVDAGSVDPKRTLAAGISLLAGIAGIVSALAGPASPIVIPIAACFVLAKWAFDFYEQTAVVLRRLMTYIIDLTLVLQNIFWLQRLTNQGHPVTCRIIKAAALVHHKSNIKQTLRFQIDQHLQSFSLEGIGPDTTLDTIVTLIEAFTIDSAEMFEQRGNLAFPNGHPAAANEEWETS